jgi:general secretion pathway protein D
MIKLSRMIVALLLLSLWTKAVAQFEEFDEPVLPNPVGSSNKDSKQSLSKEQRTKLTKANIEDISSENFPEIVESFDFQNADINDVVKAMSELTGKNFIVDPNVRGKITIVAPSKITVAEAYKAFLSALAINDLALVPSGDFVKIRSARNAQRDGIEAFSGAYYPTSDQMITRIIHLKHISAEIVNRDLKLLQSKNGEFSVYQPTNSIIISDYGSNIARIMSIISALDVPGFEDQMEVVPVKFAKSKDIAELVNKIVNKGDNRSQNTGAFSSGIPRFNRSTPTTGSQGSAYFTVIPDDRTNSIIIIGNRAGIDKIKKLLSQLDYKIRAEDQGGINVYYMKFSEAEKVAQVLTGIAKDAGPKSSGGSTGMNSPIISPISGIQSSSQEIFGGDVKITADKTTNSLVIVASKTDFDVIKSILAKIDVPRDQVFVEAIIMEMKAGDSLNYKIGWFKYDGNGTGAKGGFNTFEGTNLTDILTPQGGTGAILPFGSNDTVKITPPSGTAVTLPSLLGFINFLKGTTNANILSQPQILALDNQEAKIEVGDKVVVSATQTQGTNGTVVTPNMEEATIRLKLKPFISPSVNSVRMELEVSVKQPSTANTPEGLRSTSQPLATRSINTNIVVPNGDTAVLGGLMKDDGIETVNKVPLLGDIPILGWLFKSKVTRREKTNLVVFLTPKIIRSANDQKDMLTKKLDQRVDYVKKVGGMDPYGEFAEELRPKKTAKSPAPPVEVVPDDILEETNENTNEKANEKAIEEITE